MVQQQKRSNYGKVQGVEYNHEKLKVSVSSSNKFLIFIIFLRIGNKPRVKKKQAATVHQKTVSISDTIALRRNLFYLLEKKYWSCFFLVWQSKL